MKIVTNMEADICTDATPAVNLQFALHSLHFLFHDYKCNNLHIKFFDLFTQDICSTEQPPYHTAAVKCYKQGGKKT